jgi:hypothetical protein
VGRRCGPGRAVSLVVTSSARASGLPHPSPGSCLLFAPPHAPPARAARRGSKVGLCRPGAQQLHRTPNPSVAPCEKLPRCHSGF